MHADVLALAYEMRAIYSAEIMFKHLSSKAAAIGSQDICWSVEDLDAWFSSCSPEPILPARSLMTKPPPRVARDLPCLLSTASFEERDRQLRISLGNDDTSPWLSELFECNDPRCGCYRPAHPEVRHQFRDLFVERVAASVRARSRPRIRYVSIGSGGLLFDLELLVALQSRLGDGCIESVVVIDR